jgi:predicted DNA binding CopG/RHH family protein
MTKPVITKTNNYSYFCDCLRLYQLIMNKMRITKAKPHKKINKIPKFKTEDSERDFWAKADTTEYFDWSKTKKIKFPKLKPSVASISIRLPKGLLEDIKILANKKDVPYQSLMKIYLDEKVKHKKRRLGRAPKRV